VRPADGTPGASLRQMLDVISHELRSPLNVIQSWSHVLENELSRTLAEESGRDSAIEPSPAAQRALAGIRIGVREQVRLIDQLLDATRAINGRLTMERRPFALVPVLESAVSGVQPQATERGLTLHLDYQCPDCHVEGDAERLRQSFSHLLSNAIKFSPEQGDVQVTLRREGGELVISVIDQGPGVAPELRQEIFEWFRRGDRRQGLGLGLALSRHFARAHGGDIEVFSEAPGRGSTFTLRLPEWRPSTLAAANEEPASAPPGDRAAPPDRAPPAGPTLPASAD
jgi:signal transduction histidine kinase